MKKTDENIPPKFPQPMAKHYEYLALFVLVVLVAIFAWIFG
jgi:hypothetical protein